MSWLLGSNIFSTFVPRPLSQMILIRVILAILVALLPLGFGFARNLEYPYVIVCVWLCMVTTLSVLILKPSLIPSLSHPVTAIIYLLILCGSWMVPSVVLFAVGVCPCEWRGWSFWSVWLLIPAQTLMIGLESVLRETFTRKSFLWRILAVCLGLVVGLLVLVTALFLNPQKRLHDLFFGFIHGPIYDEWIPVSEGFFIARILAFVLGFLCLFVATNVLKSRTKRASTLQRSLLLGCFVSCVLYLWQRSDSGYGVGHLQKLLPRSAQVDGLVIWDQPGNEAYESKRILFLKEASFHIQELTGILRTNITKPIHVFLYPDEDFKKIYFGGGGTDITDVVTPSIHVTNDGFPHPTLRHELVHALASNHGWHGLGFHPNMAITEGLAVMLAPIRQDLTLDQQAAVIVQSELIADPKSIFSMVGFWKASGPRAYTMAGSLIEDVMKSLGMDIWKGVYDGSTDLLALKHNDVLVVDQWLTKLASMDVKDQMERSKHAFKRGGVLEELCPHSRADLERSAKTWWHRWRQPADWTTSQMALWGYELQPEKQEPWLELQRRLISKSLKDPKKILEIQSAVQNRLKESWVSIEDIETEVLSLDIDVLLIQYTDKSKGSKDEVGKKVLNINEKTKDRSLPPWLRRGIDIRQSLLDESESPISADVLTRLIGSLAGVTSLGAFDAKTQLVPEPGLSWQETYLRFRNQPEWRSALWSRSMESLDQIALPISIEKEWTWWLFVEAVKTQRWVEAKTLMNKLSKQSSGQELEYYETWQRFVGKIEGDKGTEKRGHPTDPN
jgi:hypothetical protein